MEMEFVTEFTDSSMNRDRVRQIIRGKRIKRQRPSSPFEISNGDHCSIDDSDQYQVMSSSTEEDEDMANCLIMLARSVSPVKEENFSDQIREKTEKFNCRRLTEMMTTSITAGGSKSSFYVYKCKTCNRTFPSFQALGGHRASHKKPKVNVDETKSSSVNISPLPLTEYSIEDEDNKASMIISNNVQKSPSSSPSGSVINHNIKTKVHECSICGSVFLSGQALGGHMRKHRQTPPLINQTVSPSNSNEITADQVTEQTPGGSSNMLSLDLNFPPPEVIDFPFTTSSSQLLSSPALVDCHY